jgi:hypothetical protein
MKREKRLPRDRSAIFSGFVRHTFNCPLSQAAAYGGNRPYVATMGVDASQMGSDNSDLARGRLRSVVNSTAISAAGYPVKRFTLAAVAMLLRIMACTYRS